MATKYFKNSEFDYKACKQDARNGVSLFDLCKKYLK